jgi:hypothetical protein
MISSQGPYWVLEEGFNQVWMKLKSINKIDRMKLPHSLHQGRKSVQKQRSQLAGME